MAWVVSQWDRVVALFWWSWSALLLYSQVSQCIIISTNVDSKPYYETRQRQRHSAVNPTKNMTMCNLQAYTTYYLHLHSHLHLLLTLTLVLTLHTTYIYTCTYSSYYLHLHRIQSQLGWKMLSTPSFSCSDQPINIQYYNVSKCSDSQTLMELRTKSMPLKVSTVAFLPRPYSDTWYKPVTLLPVYPAVSFSLPQRTQAIRKVTSGSPQGQLKVSSESAQ